MKHLFNFLTVSPLFRENLKVSFAAVKANRLRSVLTIAIIATGITSLVGIMTAIDAIKGSVTESFGKFGAGSFSIRASYTTSTQGHRRIRNKRQISYSQAQAFMKSYDVPCVKSLYVKIGSTDVFKTAETKSDPRMTLIAADESYLDFQGITIQKGEPLTRSDMENASARCILGAKAASLLFGAEDPVGKIVFLRGAPYQVAGIAGLQGDSMDSFDVAALIPVTNARISLLNEDSPYVIGIKPTGAVSLRKSMSSAEALFRAIRRLQPSDETDFSVEGSESFFNKVNDILGNVTFAAFAIGLITLLGAAVGLMNIMLVSVKERTREIGTRKALGAAAETIRQQFLMEAVLIGQIGGVIGIILGVGVANILLAALKTQGVIPWFWMAAAVLLCFAVSILSCAIPAKKAAGLDPIEALRYE